MRQHWLIAAAALIGSANAWAEPAARSLDQALTDTLALGSAVGCSRAFGIPDFPAPAAHDNFLLTLRNTQQLGAGVTAICGSSAVVSSAALGGSLGSLQTTKTVSQFRPARRRLDSRRRAASGADFGLDGSLLFAALDQRAVSTYGRASQTLSPDGWGAFAQGEYERRERHTTPLEAGYEADVLGGHAGIDYATPGGLVVGGWIGYRKADADYKGINLLATTPGVTNGFDANLIPDLCRLSPGGDFDDSGTRLGAFAGLRSGSNFADFAVHYGRPHYHHRRKVCVVESQSATLTIEPVPRGTGFESDNFEVDDIYAGTVSGNARVGEWGASLRAGRDFGDDRWLWGPRFSISYLASRIHAFVESGVTSVTNTVKSNGDVIVTSRAAGDPTGLELAFDAQNRASLQSEAQLVAAYRIERSSTTIIPRVSASWLHEFEGDRELVVVHMAQDLRAEPTRFSFTTDSVDKDKATIAVGFAALIGRAVAMDVEVSQLLGDNRFDSTAIVAQVRRRF